MNQVNKDIFEIDKNNLDKEWERQASLMYKLGELSADAYDEWSKAKSKLGYLKGSIELDYRTGRRKVEGMDKLTESSIKAAVECDANIMEWQDKVNDLKHQYDLYAHGVESLQHKKKALEQLESLLLNKYYAAPKSRETIRENSSTEDFLENLTNNM